MPKYSFTSVKEVIARIARNLGGKLPSQYHDDILEWLAEGIDQLAVTKLRVLTSTPSANEEGALEVKNHVVYRPCGILSITAIEDEYGYIIKEASDVTDITSPTNRNTPDDGSRATVFSVNPLQHQTQDGTPTEAPGSSIPVYGEDLSPINPNGTGSFYQVMGNYIQFSFASGFVKIHYLTSVLDEEGFPMVPDNENFKTALYWYVLKMLIGAGYRHQVFSYGFCDQEFEKFGARALGEIKWPSLDEKARVHHTNTQFVISPKDYNTFFLNR